MIEHGKTRVWRLDDLLPAEKRERAQPVGRNDGSGSERRIEPQRVVVIQPNTLPAPLEHEEPRRLAQQAQPAGPRARHTAEAWAAGANIGAKTELRRNDAEIMKAVAQARARRTEEASASSIVIPKMPAIAKLALLKDWLMRQPKSRVLIVGTMTLALGLVPLLLRASDDNPQAQAQGNILAPAPLSAAKTTTPDEADEAARSTRLPAAARASAEADEAASAPRASAEANGAWSAAAPRASVEANETARSTPLAAADQAAPLETRAVARTKQLQAAASAAPETTQPARPVLPTGAGNVTARTAIDALISGNPSLAAARYQALAGNHPERAELAAAARILREAAERAAASGE